ncbi:MAG: CoA-binding protein [Candidatus Aenigmarchaeota archaeon]|nr:CoA-binding protein [Candidatus Aenigmarchaeota archaeon]
MHELENFFNPTSVAVIGASHTPGKVGYVIVDSLKSSFHGKIYPINPSVTEILGLPAYTSVNNVTEPIDLAIIAVPAETVNSVLEEVIQHKIKSVIIVSSGFTGVEDKERYKTLENLIKKSKIRVIGPSSLGTFTSKLDMFFLPRERFKRPPEGYISFISQSGSVGAMLLDLISSEGVGISKFASFGSRSDVSEIELLDYLGKDLQTRCIALYIESLKDGKAFIEVAKKVVKTKPIVALKGGKDSAEIYSAAFKQAGIIEAKTTEELFDFAKVLANQPLPASKKIAIVTEGSGLGVIAANSLVSLGLEIAEFSKETVKPFKNLGFTTLPNPVDLGGESNVERYQKALDAVFKDKAVAGVICIPLFQTPSIEDSIVDILRDCKIYGKPLIVCAAGGEHTQKLSRKLEAVGIPVYQTPERAAKAMSILSKQPVQVPAKAKK